MLPLRLAELDLAERGRERERESERGHCFEENLANDRPIERPSLPTFILHRLARGALAPISTLNSSLLPPPSPPPRPPAVVSVPFARLRLIAPFGAATPEPERYLLIGTRERYVRSRCALLTSVPYPRTFYHRAVISAEALRAVFTSERSDRIIADVRRSEVQRDSGSRSRSTKLSVELAHFARLAATTARRDWLRNWRDSRDSEICVLSLSLSLAVSVCF